MFRRYQDAIQDATAAAKVGSERKLGACTSLRRYCRYRVTYYLVSGRCERGEEGEEGERERA